MTASLRAPGATTVADLVRRAADGDQRAWEQLVDRYANLIWSIAQSHRLQPSSTADVAQVVWLRLLENLDRIREPQYVGAWISSVTRRECLRVLNREGREVLTDDTDVRADTDPIELGLEIAERDALLREALAKLAPPCQSLLRMLMADPRPSYAEVANALDRPIGSLGPTRQRCLDHLRRLLKTVEAETARHDQRESETS